MQAVYNYFNRPPRIAPAPGGPSRTQQQFKNECDVKQILKRYARTGIISGNRMQPMYGDFTQITSYQEALQTVQRAAEGFNKLPAPLRDKFKNNPQNFLAFLQDPANTEEAIRLGLIPKPPRPEVPGDPIPEPKPA